MLPRVTSSDSHAVAGTSGAPADPSAAESSRAITGILPGISPNVIVRTRSATSLAEQGLIPAVERSSTFPQSAREAKLKNIDFAPKTLGNILAQASRAGHSAPNPETPSGRDVGLLKLYHSAIQDAFEMAKRPLPQERSPYWDHPLSRMNLQVNSTNIDAVYTILSRLDTPFIFIKSTAIGMDDIERMLIKLTANPEIADVLKMVNMQNVWHQCLPGGGYVKPALPRGKKELDNFKRNPLSIKKMDALWRFLHHSLNENSGQSISHSVYFAPDVLSLLGYPYFIKNKPISLDTLAASGYFTESWSEIYKEIHDPEEKSKLFILQLSSKELDREHGATLLQLNEHHWIWNEKSAFNILTGEAINLKPSELYLREKDKLGQLARFNCIFIAPSAEAKILYFLSKGSNARLSRDEAQMRIGQYAATHGISTLDFGFDTFRDVVRRLLPGTVGGVYDLQGEDIDILKRSLNRSECLYIYSKNDNIAQHLVFSRANAAVPDGTGQGIWTGYEISNTEIAPLSDPPDKMLDWLVSEKVKRVAILSLTALQDPEFVQASLSFNEHFDKERISDGFLALRSLGLSIDDPQILLDFIPDRYTPAIPQIDTELLANFVSANDAKFAPHGTLKVHSYPVFKLGDLNIEELLPGSIIQYKDEVGAANIIFGKRDGQTLFVDPTYEEHVTCPLDQLKEFLLKNHEPEYGEICVLHVEGDGIALQDIDSLKRSEETEDASSLAADLESMLSVSDAEAYLDPDNPLKRPLSAPSSASNRTGRSPSAEQPERKLRKLD